MKIWEYVLCYVNDVLVVSHGPKRIMDRIGQSSTLKPDSVKTPELYLGTERSKFYILGSDDGDKHV